MAPHWPRDGLKNVANVGRCRVKKPLVKWHGPHQNAQVNGLFDQRARLISGFSSSQEMA